MVKLGNPKNKSRSSVEYLLKTICLVLGNAKEKRVAIVSVNAKSQMRDQESLWTQD